MSNIKETVNWIKEERESSKQKVLQEVLEWLEENFFTGEQEISQYSIEVESILKSVFSSKEEMLQSFKERFNISDNYDCK